MLTSTTTSTHRQRDGIFCFAVPNKSFKTSHDPSRQHDRLSYHTGRLPQRTCEYAKQSVYHAEPLCRVSSTNSVSGDNQSPMIFWLAVFSVVVAFQDEFDVAQPHAMHMHQVPRCSILIELDMQVQSSTRRGRGSLCGTEQLSG